MWILILDFALFWAYYPWISPFSSPETLIFSRLRRASDYEFPTHLDISGGYWMYKLYPGGKIHRKHTRDRATLHHRTREFVLSAAHDKRTFPFSQGRYTEKYIRDIQKSEQSISRSKSAGALYDEISIKFQSKKILFLARTNRVRTNPALSWRVSIKSILLWFKLSSSRTSKESFWGVLCIFKWFIADTIFTTTCMSPQKTTKRSDTTLQRTDAIYRL